MNEITYSYADTNRLEDRNTYFYSVYGGKQFMDRYFELRRSVENEQIPKRPVCDSSKIPLGLTDKVISTKALLQSLTGMLHENCMSQEAWELVAKIIQRFEVSKRLYPEYKTNWRPLDTSDYNHLDLYIWFAMLMEAAYERRAGLLELNAMLKVLDSLISIRHLLSPEQKSHMGWLIQREVEIVGELSGLMELEHGT